VQYVLFDYGISSFHFDRSGRGFTFRDSEPLDMRLDGNTGPSAADLVNGASAEELADIFFHYGEERWSRKIAAYIKEQRRKKPFETADGLADIVMRAIPRRFHVKNIHPATRVFQALRIAVNNELEAIDRGLDSIYRYLDDGGRIMSMSFHSLEDRIVKNRFRQWARGCSCGLEGRQCQCLSRPFVSMVTKKPVIPTEEEIAENKRSRSARLRVCERIMR
jgi:16S rRNA (cytosine1402-N4)-methyltransferase